MRLKELRTWVVVFLVLLVVFALVGYQHYYTRDKQVTATADSFDSAPDQNEDSALDVQNTSAGDAGVRIGVIDLDYLRANHPKVQTVDLLDDQIRSYLKEQGRNQESLTQNQKQVESQYVDTGSKLSGRVEEIKASYQKKIDAKAQMLQQEFASFESALYKDATAQIQRKQADLQSMSQQLVAKDQERRLEKLAEAEKELRAQYSPQMLNLQLKLQLVQLNEADKKKYSDQLEKYQVELDQKVQELREKVQAETNQFMQSKEKELEKDFQNYQEQLKLETDKALEVQKSQLNDELQAYIKEMQKEMQGEIDVQSGRFKTQTTNGLEKAQTRIQDEVQKNSQFLRSKIDQARAEQDRLLKEIDDDINAVARQVAKEMGLDTVMTGVQTHVKAVDITDLVLSRLKK